MVFRSNKLLQLPKAVGNILHKGRLTGTVSVIWLHIFCRREKHQSFCWLPPPCPSPTPPHNRTLFLESRPIQGSMLSKSVFSMNTCCDTKLRFSSSFEKPIYWFARHHRQRVPITYFATIFENNYLAYTLCTSISCTNAEVKVTRYVNMPL